MAKNTTEPRPPHMPPEKPRYWRIRQRIFDFWERATPNIIIAMLVVVFALLTLWNRVVYTVRAGEQGVLFQRFGGTCLDETYGEGIHFISPINELIIYNMRIQEKRDTIVILSNNGLDIMTSFVYRYRPIRDKDKLPLLHQQVGPNYEAVIVTPAVKSAIREVIGKYRPEEIYTSHCNIIPSEVFREATERVKGKNVDIDAVIIENISLPPQVQQAIANKHVVEQNLLEYEFRIAKEEKEAQRKTIEARGFQQYHEILRANLDNRLLVWNGIQATLKLAESKNAKLIMIGKDGGKDGGGVGLPLILGGNLGMDDKDEAVPPLAAPGKDAAQLGKDHAQPGKEPAKAKDSAGKDAPAAKPAEPEKPAAKANQ